MKARFIALVLFCVVPARMLKSQQTSNFSGTWVLNPLESRLEIKDPPVASTFIIKQRGSKWRLRRTHTYQDGSRKTATIALTTDGRHEIVERDGSGGQSVTRMYRDGDEMVLDQRLTDAHGLTGSNIVHYSLSTDGQTMTAMEFEDFPNEKLKNEWVFERKTGAKPSKDKALGTSQHSAPAGLRPRRSSGPGR